MIAAPRPEFPEFIAGLAYLAALSRDSAIAALETRLATVLGELAELERETESAATWLPRIVLIENEYLIGLLRSDRHFIDALLDDLRSGRLDWSVDELIELARRFDT